MPRLLKSSGLDAAFGHKQSLRFPAAISLLIVSLMFGGCSQAPGGNSMSLKWPDMNQKEMPVKSSYAFGVTKSFTDINNKITTAPSYRVYVASYDLDATNFSQTMDKPLAADDQIRVTFNLVGDEGGTEKTVLKAGDYSAKAEKFMRVETAGIVTRKDGKDNTLWLDRSALTGSVKITAATGESVTGEADLSDGQAAIKGPFTAKILVRK